jgi:hypothetical protein
MSAKAVKTLAVSGLGTYKILEAQLLPGEEVDAIDVTTFEDAKKAKVPHPQPDLKVWAFKLDHGTGRPTVGVAGVSVVVSGTLDDGTAYTNTVSGFIQSANPTTVQVGGDRVPAWDVEFCPTGGGSITTTTTGA